VKRYFELFFRHPILFSLPMVVALVAGVAYASKAPPMYISSATVFCDASLPNASTLSQGVSGGGTTPAADKMSTLQEFLRTQSFVDKVAHRSPLASFLATHSQPVDQLVADAMRKTITVSTAGPHLLVVSVKAGSPVLAAGTVTATIQEFTVELGALLKSRGQSLAAIYQAELDATTRALATAQTAGDLALAQQQHASALDRYNQAVSGATGAAVDPTAFHIVDPPKAPGAPVSRKKQLLMSGVGGLLGGSIISIIALVLLMAQDRSVREEQDVEEALDLEVLSTVPQFHRSVLSKTLHRQSDPQGWFWTPPGLVESCTLALRRLERDDPTPLALPRGGLRVTRRTATAGRGSAPTMPRTIGVTSCLRGEGRSTIAAGLAAAAWQGFGLKAIVVEFDFDQPSLARRLGIDPSPGVAEILRDGALIEECLRIPDDASVGALVAGNTGSDRAGLLSSVRASSIVADLGAFCDIVIADLPPLGPTGQAASLAPLFSTVLLTVRSGTAAVGQIRRGLDDLGKPPSVILNGVESSIPRPLRALLAG
jgi:Mrp family chromosome partitioning ATPase